MSENKSHIKNDFDKFEEAVKIVIEAGQASTSLVQRRLKVGYAHASKMIDKMENLGIIGTHKSSKPREVLMTYQDWLDIRDKVTKSLNVYEDSIPTTEITMSVEEDIKNQTGITVDYTKDGYFIKRLQNTIVPQSDEHTQIKFINNLIKYASPNILKIMIVGDNLFIPYKGLPNLLVPVITDVKKAELSLNWLTCEMLQRNKIFSQYYCKDIDSYNDLIESNLKFIAEQTPEKSKEPEVMKINGLPVPSKKMFHCVFIIQEIWHLLKSNEFDNLLTSILFTSKASGIHIIAFSKLTLKNLSLNIKEELFEICTKENLENLFKQNSPMIPTVSGIN